MAEANQERSAPPSPALAEQARTLVFAAKVGTLATSCRTHPGFPFQSIAPFAESADGCPLFLFSSLAQHTKNLIAEPRASFLVSEQVAEGRELAAARTTLLGTLSQTESTDGIRNAYLAAHPEAAQWVDFGDFSFFRMEVERAYHVAGFGSMSWIDGEAYRSAEVDPLAESAASMIAHMNEDHADALVLYARAFADFDAERATMTAIDRLGFELLAVAGEESRSLRISFEPEVRTPIETRKALVAMVQRARAAIAE